MSQAAGHQSSGDDSSDKTTKVALGVGLGVGIPILVLLGACVWLGVVYLRRRYPGDRRLKDGALGKVQMSEEPRVYKAGGSSRGELKARPAVVELNGI
ncbi:hypothetical protein K458DRAFT_413740 [Lentithecium fluviatile CBS 122367]|uniref:Mid2 domain-containing protein n=1 Tax=Lentithecium fluviatile CBS 122367 TaxID=1168545 RepID=A0A6G1JG71_9PLEO|nr:hypothetical protein K458DRAFT_413740 [Lentithecium fluviatile CBS 122367]